MRTGLRVNVCVQAYECVYRETGDVEEKEREGEVAGMNSWADHRVRQTGSCLSGVALVALVVTPVPPWVSARCFDFLGRQVCVRVCLSVCACGCVCLTCLKSHLGCNQAKQIWVWVSVQVPMCQVFVTFGKFKVCQFADKLQPHWHIPQRLGYILNVCVCVCVCVG